MTPKSALSGRGVRPNVPTGSSRGRAQSAAGGLAPTVEMLESQKPRLSVHRVVLFDNQLIAPAVLSPVGGSEPCFLLQAPEARPGSIAANGGDLEEVPGGREPGSSRSARGHADGQRVGPHERSGQRRFGRQDDLVKNPRQ